MSRQIHPENPKSPIVDRQRTGRNEVCRSRGYDYRSVCSVESRSLDLRIADGAIAPEEKAEMET